MNEFTPNHYNPYQSNAARNEQIEATIIYDEPIVETAKNYEMSAADIDHVASAVFEQVAQNPDSVAYHIYNSELDRASVRGSELISGHNYLPSNDEYINKMQEALRVGLEQTSRLKNDDRFTKPEILIIEEQADGSSIVGYGLVGKDDTGRPKYDDLSFRLNGEAAAMLYAVAEDPVAVDQVIKMVGYASDLPDDVYKMSFDPAHNNFGDQVLNIVKTGPRGSEFSRIKKRSKSTIK